MITAERLAAAFVEVADSLVADFDLVDFLHTLTLRAASVSGAASVGLMLADERGSLRYMASSDDGAQMMEMFQIQADEGPCLDCYRTRTPVVNADLGNAQDQWPRFAPVARGAGYRSVHAFPMRWRDDVIGALNLFGVSNAPFSATEVPVVKALADVATIALLQERAAARADLTSQQLQGALNSRIVIEQAKGVLAQQEGITPSEAFTLLRETARSARRKLSDVATEVVDSIGGQDGGASRWRRDRP